MMLSISFANAQLVCNGNKIRVYKCNKSSGFCDSKCVNSINIPVGRNTVCCGPCSPPAYRNSNEQTDLGVFQLTILPIPYSGPTTI